MEDLVVSQSSRERPFQWLLMWTLVILKSVRETSMVWRWGRSHSDEALSHDMLAERKALRIKRELSRARIADHAFRS